MAKKDTIQIDLYDSNSWDSAIKEIKEYEEWLKRGTQRFVELLAEVGLNQARVNFTNAIYPGLNDVVVNTEITETKSGYKATVIAEGEAVAFIEFGTGITQGDNPTERAEVLSGNVMPHGWYGQGKGANPKGWIYKGMPGNSPDTYEVRPGVYRTKGNPANSSLWLAKQTVEESINECLKEAFR